jgi:hypothetical protein
VAAQVRWALVVACAACRGNDAPLEKLPAPPPAAWNQHLMEAPPPPPPPPPPKGGEVVGPPDVVRTFLRGHTGCSVHVARGGHAGSLARAQQDELLARLDREDAWVGGVTGCVGDVIELRIDCAGDATALRITADCGNVTVGEAHGTWSEGTLDWIEEALRSQV